MAPVLSDLASLTDLRKVAEGASAEVWKGREADGGEVACKVARSAGMRATVEQEAMRLAWLDGPGLPELLGVGRWTRGALAGAPVLVQRWLPGRTLRELLGAGRRSDRLAAIVAHAVGGALVVLERAGVAHGDVKPDNILVDEASGRAWLIDLGLGGEGTAAHVTGGTPRYLAPEVMAGRVVERRLLDRFALGEVLLEAGATGERAEVARALASPVAQARPSPALLLRDEGAGQAARWRAEVRSAYLGVRRGELTRAATGDVSWREPVAAWLPARLERLQAACALGGHWTGTATTLGALDAAGRQRWLAALVGPAASSWPVARLGAEDTLARALEALAARRAPAGWSFADVTHALVDSDTEASAPWAPVDDVELALQLALPVPREAALLAAERRLREGQAPDALAVALIEALRRRGQPARALLAAPGAVSEPVRLARAEAARRARDVGLAAELLGREVPDGMSPRARALAARLQLDAGRPDEALARLDGVVDDAAGCEVRAVALAALGRRGEAREAAERGLALADDDESRARLGGALGFVAHGQGDPAAQAAYASAAAAAERAGALTEEATYRTGEAAGAVDAGALGAGIEAARRAVALWDALGRRGDGARALLSHAAALRVLGAQDESRRVAREAFVCAEQASDRRAQVYALLTEADATPGPDAVPVLERARELLDDPGDRLRWAARALPLGLASARETVAARGAVDASAVAEAEASAAQALEMLEGRWSGRADELVERLLPLCEGESVPVATRGEAAQAGRKLALARGLAVAAGRFGSVQRAAAGRLLGSCPAEYRASLLARPWLLEASLAPDAAPTAARTEAALQLVRGLSGRDRLRPLLQQIVDALVLWTGVERGLLLMPTPGGELVPRVARNLSQEDLRGEQLRLSTTLAARALAERRPVVAVDAAGESADTLASVHLLQLRSVLAVPLLARGEALGVVYLDDRLRRGAFSPDDIGWVDLMAAMAAVALADARDQVRLRRVARQARLAEEKLARTLARREDEIDALERSLAGATPGRREHRFDYSEITGSAPSLDRALRLVDRVAPTDLPVMLFGETGTGKELFARALHRHSRRAEARFFGENCGAIPEPLLESTLFGHVKGAFTGADRTRPGLFELADGGTLFLDEIGEMPLAMQAKLLRVLQDGEMRPVGSNQARKVNVRIVAATHRDLTAMVAAGTFREDLYFRLRVVEITIPPLRERPEDIPLLVQHFLKKYGEGRKLRIATQAMERLVSFGWPGNIRQLENVLRAAIVMSDGTIERSHLGLDAPTRSAPATSPGSLSLRERIDALEAELIREALGQTRNNQSKAAELLGVSRFGLQKMIKRLKIVT